MTPEQRRQILEETYGVLDTAATIGSSLLAEPLSGWAGILAGGDADAVRRAQEALQYVPRTDEGRRNLGYLGDAVQGVMDYQPPLRDQTIGEDLQDIGDYWRDTSVPALQETFGEEVGAGIGAAGIGILGSVGLPARAKRVVGGRGGPEAHQTVDNPERIAYPGIYKDTQQILEESNALLAPESPAMERLFGVRRSDLTDLAMNRGEGADPWEFLPGYKMKGRGNARAQNVMTDENAGRLSEIITQSFDTPLGQSMAGWYPMDPVYDRLKQLSGGEAADRFNRFQHLTGFHSANSEVPTELVRGTAANWLNEQGRLSDYFKYGNKADRIDGGDARPRPDRPVDMDAVPGHMGHKTSHGTPTRKFLESGTVGNAPKVPAYIAASQHPDVGPVNTNFSVGDAHFSRALGLADVRPWANVKDKKTGEIKQEVPGASWSMPEAQTIMPWFSDIASETGMTNVPKQAVLWGALSPQTGVTSPIGQPKLEILSDQIMKTADRLGISPEEARDRVLMGKAHAGFVDPRLLPWMGALGAGGYIASGMLGDDMEDTAEAFKPRQYP
jgi:hypothetical protein